MNRIGITCKTSIVIPMIFVKTALEVLFYFGVVPVYNEWAFFSWNPNISAFILSYVFVGMVAATQPRRGISCFLCLMLEIFSTIPIICFGWMTGENIAFSMIVTMINCIINLIAGYKNNKALSMKVNVNSLKLLFIIYILLTVYLYSNSNGFDYRAMMFMDNKEIYNMRNEMSLSGITGYLYNWTSKVFFIFFFTIGLWSRSRIMVLFSVASQVTMFMCYGNKISLFLIPFCAILYDVVSRKGDNIRKIILASILLFLIIPVMINIDVLKEVGRNLNTQVGMRSIYLPAYIQFEFYNFFQSHDLLLYSEGLIGKISGLDYPYPRAIGVEVSNFFLGEGNAGNHNCGIFGDAYANCGISGMIIMGLILGSLLREMDKVIFVFPVEMKAVFGGAYAIYMCNNGLFTTLLTNGLLILISMCLLSSQQIRIMAGE